MEWLWFNEPVEVSGPRASLVKAEASEFRISLKHKGNQTINTCRRRSQAGWSPALLVSVFLFCWGEQGRQCETLPQMGDLHFGHQPGESREEKQFLGWDRRVGRGGKEQHSAEPASSVDLCLSNFIVALKCTILLHVWGKLWKQPNFAILLVEPEPSIPLDPQDTENQVHHWDCSSILSYSVSTCMALVVWLSVAKSHKKWGYFLQSCHLKLLWVIWLDL